MILVHPNADSHPDPADVDLVNATWIDLVEPTEADLGRVVAATGLRVPDRNQVSEIESSSRLRFEKGAYHLSTSLVAPGDDGELTLTPVGFVLSARLLLTVRFAGIHAFDAAHKALEAQKTWSAEEAFLCILEVVIDRSADMLERAGVECDALSRRAFYGGSRKRLASDLRSTLSRIGAVAGHTSRIRDALLGLGRIAAFVMESGIEGAPHVNAARIKAIRSDVASLTDYEAHLSGKVQFLLDATLGFINIEQNEIVKILTIASVVGIPPVLLAGIYGMNFRYMPELTWKLGYPFALVLIVASALAPMLWFRRRGWI